MAEQRAEAHIRIAAVILGRPPAAVQIRSRHALAATTPPVSGRLFEDFRVVRHKKNCSTAGWHRFLKS
jgi:hypothetical protein